MKQPTPRGRYFEDFVVGEELVSPARTVTQTDIVNFACLSGDFNEVHTNFEYCKDTKFGEPIAHGPLVYSIMGGLQYASGINDGTLIALLQIDEWRMIDAVKHGDTIRLHSEVLDKKETSKPDKGVITFRRKCIKQNGTVAQEMIAKLLYRRRPRE
ncbi:MaoC/PaaZ C-terminal domain-containing protein [Halomonas sp. HK25]|uniref:MaoC/PaaZ C-terminal domain-containing protein n=1 Tax=Halomonas sp. HK25 TaxID=3394321 RepID=UPI0039FBE9ED